MLPQSQINQPTQNLPSDTSSLQSPPQDPNSQNLSGFDKLTMQFGNVATQFQTLSELYPGGEEEFRDAVNAMSKWLAKVGGSLNIPSNGGSATGVGNNPSY